MTSPQNSTGIAGAWHIPDAANVVYYMLHGLQHRGSDGAGIAAANGQEVKVFKRTGMLAETFNPERLAALDGDLAIGQVRVATSSDISSENLQPVMVRAHQGSFGVVSTGMVLNAPSLRRHMEAEGLIFQGTSDAEIIAHLIQVSEGKMVDKVETAAQQLKGSFAFIVMTKNTMYAVLSRQAAQSLYYGEYEGGYLLSQETSGFSLFDVEKMTAVEPGQMIILGKEGFKTRQIDIGSAHHCAMECVYYSREDSLFNGQSIHKIRQALGSALAKGETRQADIVIGVPDTAMAAASAFAQTLKVPYEIGLIKNRYVGSTFVHPAKEQKERSIKVRLNAISSIVKDKSIFLVDDSIQKGATAAHLCRMLKEAGAREVHLRIASPKILYSCIFGTEYIEASELAARNYTEEELCEIFGADSLRFLDLSSFGQSLGESSCRACMNGEYFTNGLDYEQLCGCGKEIQ